MNIIKLRSVWYVISAVLVGGSLVLLATFGLKQGIDFTGGTELSVRFEKRPTPVEVEGVLTSFQLGEITIQPVGDTDMNVRMKTIEENQHQDIVKKLGESFGKVSELQYNAIGPAVGVELRQKSVSALTIVFLAILAFIAWSFRKVAAPVKSWKYGMIVLATAFHDVAIPLGLFAILGKYAGVEIGTPFIAAILTIMGYSINDTIVVLDRVRENLQKTTGVFEDIVERSVQQTMLRSFNTSMTTTLALLAVYFFGGESIKNFALALIVGIVTGTYSSIFIASPLLVTWNKWSHRSKS
ncbi:protein translocase subunit SecF [Patescibacteria group bacterium]|nr:protein translocase subunit SecF [Patescibacteria group bacterium]